MIKQIYTCCLVGLITFASCKKDNIAAHVAGAAMRIDNFTPETGGRTTEILISGDNFAMDTSQLTVTINGHKCTVLRTNMNQLMAIVPKQCGTGHIVVTSGKDSVVSTKLFNYVYTRSVTTLAGNGKAGYANGKGTDAQFNFNGESWYRSAGIVVDDQFNVFVTDVGNHCIRKIDSAGNVSLFVGSPGISGFAEGKGTDAKFSLLYGMTMDGQGNIYTADPGNWDIRKITPDGNATVLVWGNVAPWFITYDKVSKQLYYAIADSPGSVWRINSDNSQDKIINGINYPGGIAFDPQGSLIMSVNGDHTLLRFDAKTWTSTVIAGSTGQLGYVNGSATTARFSLPWDLTLDAQGNIYLAGDGNISTPYNIDQSVRFISAGTYDVRTYAGGNAPGFTNGVGEAASFAGPVGVALDKNGTLYVKDKDNNCIRKIISE
ncbi:IPT/TIG domain-containing protein [Chitinophaga sp. Hz27]|uniref:IPT/TIG domain-containing protein n=1 Tax=Chitinophaga sp. Hz27 TaxID=3347169 RepID=UPI0035D565EE